MRTSSAPTFDRISDVLRRIVIPGLMVTVLLAIGVFGIVSLVLEVARVRMLAEAGYGDSYILYDVLHLQRTGVIYRDLSQPPYLPSLYSPLVYVVFSAANRALGHANAFVGPRLIVIAAFVGCVATTVSIVRTLIPGRGPWIWGILLAASVFSMQEWLLQIRADFLGIVFSLLAVRLLLSSERRGSVLLAGMCAGLALQFKITLVAAGAAGVLWLALQRRRAEAVRFAVIATVVAAGPYWLYSLHEPRMIAQMMTLSRGVSDVKGSIGIMDRVASEPVVALALAGLPVVIGRNDRRWWLLLTFCGLSAGLAAVTAIQAGANINYYFEALFGVVAIAVLGLLLLVRLSRRATAVGLLVIFLGGRFVMIPRAEAAYRQARAVGSVVAKNQEWQRFGNVLAQYRTFSTIPRIALMDSRPTLMEPFLLSYLLRLGRVDQEPILASIRAQTFDGVVTSPVSARYRDIPHVNDALREAIANAYAPRCTVLGLIVHLPRRVTASDSALAQDLSRIGCRPLVAVTAPVF